MRKFVSSFTKDNLKHYIISTDLWADSTMKGQKMYFTSIIYAEYFAIYQTKLTKGVNHVVSNGPYG